VLKPRCAPLVQHFDTITHVLCPRRDEPSVYTSLQPSAREKLVNELCKVLLLRNSLTCPTWGKQCIRLGHIQRKSLLSPSPLARRSSKMSICIPIGFEMVQPVKIRILTVGSDAGRYKAHYVRIVFEILCVHTRQDHHQGHRRHRPAPSRRVACSRRTKLTTVTTKLRQSQPYQATWLSLKKRKCKCAFIHQENVGANCPIR
jgi:hypothetical protein